MRQVSPVLQQERLRYAGQDEDLPPGVFQMFRVHASTSARRRVRVAIRRAFLSERSRRPRGRKTVRRRRHRCHARRQREQQQRQSHQQQSSHASERRISVG